MRKPQPTGGSDFPALKVILEVDPPALIELPQLVSKYELSPPSSIHIAYS